MQAISQFYQYHPNILGHGDKHLAQVFCLSIFFGLEINARKLGDPIYQQSNLFTELPDHILISDNGVFHHIMQQGSTDGGSIHFDVCQNQGYFNRMADVGISRYSLLVLMRFTGVLICLGYESQIGIRIIRAYLIQYLL